MIVADDDDENIGRYLCIAFFLFNTNTKWMCPTKDLHKLSS